MIFNFSRYTRPYFESFLIAVVCMWLPSKILGYIIPFVCLGWFIVRANSGKSLVRTGVVLALFLFVIGFYWLYYSVFFNTYTLSASFLSIMTYGTILFMLAMPTELMVDKKYYGKIIQVLQAVILFEGLVGIFQYAAACVVREDLNESVGDVVQGTIYPMAFLERGDMGFGNIIFAINMVFMLLFFLPYVISHKKGRFVAFIGLLSFFLTVASHIIISLFVATLIVWLVFQKFSSTLRKSTVVIAGLGFLAVFIFYQFSPRNFTLAVNYWNRYTEFKSLKVIATLDFFKKLPNDYPAAVYVGLGPGQYSSRAGLISSGRYFGGNYNRPKKIPLLPVQMSEPFERYAFQTFREYLKNPTYGSSTMSRPFYSVLSIVSEFGIVIFFTLILLICVYIYRLKSFYTKNLKVMESIEAYYVFSCAVSIIFIVIMSFFENYLEVPQAVLPGLMLVRLFYSTFNSSKYIQAAA